MRQEQERTLADDVLEGRDRLLMPAFAAEKLAVDEKTLTKWARAGKIRSVKTAGGHRRYPESAVRALLNGEGGDQ